MRETQNPKEGLKQRLHLTNELLVFFQDLVIKCPMSLDYKQRVFELQQVKADIVSEIGRKKP